MNSPTVHILRITYLGASVPPATVQFRRGLNVIVGASDTGKTFVVETIDFMLGGSAELRELRERRGYEKIVMVFGLSDDSLYTVQRSVDGGGYLWAVGDHSELRTDSSDPISQAHSATNDNNLSMRILRLLNLVGKRLRKNKEAETVSFTLRHLAFLSIIRETRIIEPLSPVLSPNMVARPVERAAFKFCLTGVDDSSLVAVRKAMDEQSHIVAKREALASVVESRRAALVDPRDLDYARDNLERIEKQIAAIGDDAAGYEREYADMSARYQRLRRFLEVAARRSREIDGLLSRFTLLDDHYTSDVLRLTGIAEAAATFSALHPGPCPFCGAPPDAQRHDEGCDVDPKTISDAAAAEIQRITVLRSGLAETQQRLTAELQEVTAREERAEAARKATDSLMETSSAALRERRRGVSDLQRDAQQLRLKLRDVDILAQLEKELEALNQEVVEAQEAMAADTGTKFPPADTSAFAEALEKTLIAWDYPDTGRVTWEDAKADVIIGGRRRGDQGKGLRAITCSAFILTLRNWCVSQGRPHMGFVALDSPLLAYWKPEGKQDDLTGTKVDENFYEWLLRIPDDHQTLIIENRPVPIWVEARANVIHFTKNPVEGRYGLFPLR